MSSTSHRSGAAHRRVARLLAACAVVPLALGPVGLAAASADPTTTTTTTTPETTVPETTVPDTTTPETTIPETTIPETTIPETTAPETTVPETVVPETTTPETTAPETTTPEATTPETTVPETTVPETTIPETTIPETTIPETTTPATTTLETTTLETTTTTAPGRSSAPAVPVANAAGQPTAWTVGLEVTDTFGYDVPWSLSISETVLTRDTFQLRDGERSPDVIRPDDGDYIVQVTASGLDTFWSCVGDDSTVPQTSTATFLQVFVTPDDTRMDCTLTLTNPTPSTLVIEHVFPKMPAATATYDIVYGTRQNPTTMTPGAGGTLSHGQSTTLTTWQGQSLFITGASVVGGWLVDVDCSNAVASGFFLDWNPFRADATILNFRMRAGETTTCQFVYDTLGTVTIVEDIDPDGAGAPPADFTASPTSSIATGPAAFSLSDGQTQTLGVAFNQSVFVERAGLPEYVLESLDCVRLLSGGGTEPASIIASSVSASGSSSVRVAANPGIDVVCTFTSVPAGPPTVTVSQRLLVVDPALYADLSVELRDATTNALLETIDFTTASDPSGVGITLPDRGQYSLTVVDDQGLDITWSCGTQIGNTTTFDLLLGEGISCQALADENPATGSGSLTLTKAVSPDQFYDYDVEVLLGAYPIAEFELSVDGGPVTVNDLAVGEHVVIETTPFDTQLTGIDCGPAATSTITRTSFRVDGNYFWRNQVTVTIADGAAVSCSLTNELVEPPTALDVYVDIDPSDGTESVTITVEPASAVTSGPAVQTITGGSGVVSFILDNDADVTVTQSALAGFRTQSACGFDPYTTSLSQAFTTPATGGVVNCSFLNGSAPPIVTVGTQTNPLGLAQVFEYTVDPASAVTVGPDVFSHVDGDTTELEFDLFAVDPTITQTPVPGFVTFTACYVPAESAFIPWVVGNVAAPQPTPGDEIVCLFRNVVAEPTYTVSIDVDVSTGPVDLSDEYEFLTEVSGAGLLSPTGVGTAQSISVADGARPEFRIEQASAITISPSDVLAGPNGFEYRITCDGNTEVNQPLTFTPSADTDCSLSFEARTVTVEKRVEPFVVGGFDTFDIEIDTTVEGVGGRALQDGDRETFVIPLAGTVDVIELDPGPYDATTDCTEVDLGGAVFPLTGPFGGASVTLPDDRTSYECTILNNASLAPSYEVVVESELDLGAVAIPEQFPGIDVEFDGDLARGGDGGPILERPRPSVATGGAFGARPPVVGPVASLIETVTVPPNGSASVLVTAGGDVTIAARGGSEAFATSISCPGGTTNADGSVTLSGLSGGVTCLMTNTAANLTLRNSVVGETSVTAWPYSITNVIAGPSTPSLGRTGSVTVAVAVDSLVTMTQTSAMGATTVDNSCGPITTPRPAGGFLSGGSVGLQHRPALAALFDTSQSVTLAGGSAVTCTFVSRYETTSPPTTPATTVPVTTVPGTTPGTTVPVTTPGTTAPGGTAPGPVPSTTPGAPATTVPSTPTALPPAPFAPPAGTATTTPGATTPGTTPDGDDPTTTTTTTSTTTTITTTTITTSSTATTAPPTDQPPIDQPPAGEPDTTEDPPSAMITDDGPGDIFVDIGDPIPVEIDCDGEVVILVNGVPQQRVDQIEPSALGLGDHVIEVRCDGATITEVRAVVFEQDEGAPAGSNMTVIVMFVVMAAGAFLFAPSAAGRKRLSA